MLVSSLSLSLLLAAAMPSLASPLAHSHAVTGTNHSSSPLETGHDWAAGAVTEIPIHHSCNATEQAQLRRAFADGIKLAHHAKSHILRWGNSSTFYQKYFGNAPTAEPIGWFERVVSADRAGILFRCDDIDGNCARNPTWGGHWRGSNATDETVICPLSYTSRWYLEAMCGFGYTVAASNTNSYFGSDMLHRWFHLPAISEGVVEHYAEDYASSLELAKSHPEEAVRNSDTLQYFALDVYAYDIALPGQGCTGEAPPASSSAAAAAAEATSSAASSATHAGVQATTASAPAKSCHTHSDGSVHCE